MIFMSVLILSDQKEWNDVDRPWINLGLFYVSVEFLIHYIFIEDVFWTCANLLSKSFVLSEQRMYWVWPIIRRYEKKISA